MIYALMFGLSLLLLLPLAFTFVLRRGALADRRETAIALHRSQLAELARDLADNRIAATEYAGAKLEIERRLLAADALTDTKLTGNSTLLLIATAIAVPIMAFALYLPGSTPNVPSEPHAQWLALQEANNAKLIGFITALRMKLADVDPNSPDASQGEAYLAEALSEQAGGVTQEALSYFKQSLATAPPNAPWRGLVEQRLAQANAQ
jgi:cytochrome c-type biogenesis protein CcmH